MSSFDHLGFTLLRVFFENPPILLRKKGTFSEEDQKKSKRKLPSAFDYAKASVLVAVKVSKSVIEPVEITADEKFSCWF